MTSLVSQTDALYELHDAVATSVGWKFLRKPGNSHGLEVDGVGLGSSPSTTANLSVPLPLAYTCGVPKVCSNKRLKIGIKFNSLAEIRGYLFNFGIGVPEN